MKELSKGCSVFSYSVKECTFTITRSCVFCISSKKFCLLCFLKQVEFSLSIRYARSSFTTKKAVMFTLTKVRLKMNFPLNSLQCFEAMNTLITHFLSPIGTKAFKNKLNCGRLGIDKFITHFSSHTIIRKKF